MTDQDAIALVQETIETMRRLPIEAALKHASIILEILDTHPESTVLRNAYILMSEGARQLKLDI
jgi:F420-0:gamma-glutamyl ligase-like protein